MKVAYVFCTSGHTAAGQRSSAHCFPDLYAALAGDPPEHVITL
jgi:hypothetical protein